MNKRTYTRDSIIKMIADNGYTDFQAELVYDEQNLSCYVGDEVNSETDDDILTECDKWWDMQECMEKCKGYCE